MIGCRPYDREPRHRRLQPQFEGPKVVNLRTPIRQSWIYVTTWLRLSVDT